MGDAPSYRKGSPAVGDFPHYRRRLAEREGKPMMFDAMTYRRHDGTWCAKLSFRDHIRGVDRIGVYTLDGDQGRSYKDLMLAVGELIVQVAVGMAPPPDRTY